MKPMTQERAQKVKEFLESKPASLKVAPCLKPKVEIGLVLNEIEKLTYKNTNSKPEVLHRDAINPDIVFYFNDEAIQNLLNHSCEDVGEFGIYVLKEYFKKNISFKIFGGLLSLSSNGYLKIIQLGGVSFAKYLAEHGVASISKIISMVLNRK